MNKGASYLVAPHNLTFNNRAMNVTHGNHSRVVSDIKAIIDRHNAAEAQKLAGLSPEIVAERKTQKPPEIQRTEELLSKINKNLPGQVVNGRKLTQPHVRIYDKLRRRSSQARMSATRKGSHSNTRLSRMSDADREEIKDATQTILIKSGSSGGNKSLFVSSKAALNSVSPARTGNLTNTQGLGGLQRDISGAMDYTTLKSYKQEQKAA